MTKWIFSVLVALGAAVSAADLSGRWTLRFDPDFSGNPSVTNCVVKQDGTKLTLDCEGAQLTGDVMNENITIRVKTGRDGSVTATLAGMLDQTGTIINGMWHLDPDPDNKVGNFELKKR